MAIHAWGHQNAGRNGQAAHDAALNGSAINGHAHGFANAHVLERILAFGAIFQLVAAQVQAKENGSNFGAVQHRQGGRVAQACNVLRGQVGDCIDVASQKCSDAGGIRFDGGVNHVSDIALKFVPPGFVVRHDQLLVGLPLFDDIRACAVGVVGSKSNFFGFVVLDFF